MQASPYRNWGFSPLTKLPPRQRLFPYGTCADQSPPSAAARFRLLGYASRMIKEGLPITHAEASLD